MLHVIGAGRHVNRVTAEVITRVITAQYGLQQIFLQLILRNLKCVWDIRQRFPDKEDIPGRCKLPRCHLIIFFDLTD